MLPCISGCCHRTQLHMYAAAFRFCGNFLYTQTSNFNTAIANSGSYINVRISGPYVSAPTVCSPSHKQKIRQCSPLACHAPFLLHFRHTKQYTPPHSLTMVDMFSPAFQAMRFPFWSIRQLLSLLWRLPAGAAYSPNTGHRTRACCANLHPQKPVFTMTC